MRVILFGGTGMLGRGVLLECLEDPRVTSIVAVGRSPVGESSAKIEELRRTDLLDWSDAPPQLAGADACFFCLGVSSAGMSEAEYERVTYDLTIAAARAVEAGSPGCVFCYISGQGADSSERGRVMWARVKGKTENQLLRMNLKAYIFRPGFVQPMKGVHSRTMLYEVFYAVLRPVGPLLRPLFGRYMTTTVNIGRAMIALAAGGSAKRVLENRDIDALAARG